MEKYSVTIEKVKASLATLASIGALAAMDVAESELAAETAFASAEPAAAVGPARPAIGDKLPPLPNCQKTPLTPLTEPPIIYEPGLHIVIDQPKRYTVYGYDSSQIFRQIARCNPFPYEKNEGPGIAATRGQSFIESYRVKPFYSQNSQEGEGGQDSEPYIEPAGCVPEQVNVTFHGDIIYPSWGSAGSPGVSPGTGRYWRQIIKDVKTHEQRHMDANIRYAHKLYNGLEAFPLTPCDELPDKIDEYKDMITKELLKRQAQIDGV